MSNECEHGQLKRQCELCELLRRIVQQAAHIRRLNRVLAASVAVACADDGSCKDAELDKLERVLMDEGWITTAIVPVTDNEEQPE